MTDVTFLVCRCTQPRRELIKREAMKPGNECINRGFLSSELIFGAPGFLVSCSNFGFSGSNFRRSRLLVHTLTLVATMNEFFG
jgi:hypothetical protein